MRGVHCVDLRLTKSLYAGVCRREIIDQRVEPGTASVPEQVAAEEVAVPGSTAIDPF